MAPEIRGAGWNDHEVADSDLDPRLTTGTHIGLACLIRLDRVNEDVSEWIGGHETERIP
jgi:hypothetical protein